MPIYAYKCDSCGFAKDVLQKISDTPLSQCPSCGAASYRKQVTAAGFQLKGSGWYVTDFRGGNNAASKSDDKPAEAGTSKTDTAAVDAKPAAAAAPVPAAEPAPKKATTTPSSGSDS